MKKMMILLAALALLCCGCGTAIDQPAAQTEPEMTAPALEDVSGLEAPEEETAAPAEETAAPEEGTAAPAEEQLTAPALEEVVTGTPAGEESAAEENRDADFAWFGRGVYQARIGDIATGEYYLFSDTKSGILLTPGFSYAFTCNQSKTDVAFSLDGTADATVYAIESMEDDGTIIADIGEARYTFTLLPVDPDEFSLEGWEQTHQEE